MRLWRKSPRTARRPFHRAANTFYREYSQPIHYHLSAKYFIYSLFSHSISLNNLFRLHALMKVWMLYKFELKDKERKNCQIHKQIAIDTWKEAEVKPRHSEYI
jgi:hypothetical protein